MEVLGDLVARDRRHDRPLVRFDEGPSGAYTAHKFCTDAWKTANLFRYQGLGPGRTVAIADDPEPPVLLSLFGAALLGARAEFVDVPADVDSRILLADAAILDDLALPPGTKPIAYNGPPEDPAITHFERDIWSENPTMPPDSPDPDDPVLVTGDDTLTHAELLESARGVLEKADLTDDDAVAIRASFTEPGVVAAGVIAPLLAGGSVLLPQGEITGTAAVGEPVGEERAVALPSR